MQKAKLHNFTETLHTVYAKPLSVSRVRVVHCYRTKN